jgi:hypothetical protein
VPSALVIPLGEPNVLIALLKAAQANGARYVHNFNDGTGWHTHDALPRVPVFFRVSGRKVWIRTAEKVEFLVANVVGGKLSLEPNAEKYLRALV